MLPLIGSSPPLARLLDEVRRVADSEATVLVTGETGTGKELVARAIHDLSRRRPGPFVPVDCGAISDDLFDSELFGHRRGAFTGAERDRAGKLRLAEGGTLFLDAIDTLSAPCQTRLLRAIQEKEVQPLGQSRATPVSFRLVSSVTQEFGDRLERGEFRRDLYFRINVVQLRLPPLRERPGDVDVLARHFLADACRRFGKRIGRIDDKAVRVLESYGWPGNVRELVSVIECAAASARAEVLYESDLPVHVRIGAADIGAADIGAADAERDAVPVPPPDPASRTESTTASTIQSRAATGLAAAAAPSPAPGGGTFTEQVAAFQRRLLVESLARNGWSYRACGEELGLARHQVKYLCAKLGVRRSRVPALPGDGASPRW